MQSALSFARAPAAGARTLAAAHRPRARHMVAAARPITTKAQADDKAGAAEGGAADVPAAPSQEQQHAVAPRAPTGLLGMSAAPSWGRMNQMMRQMEAEMDAMSRAFGMPSLLGPSLFDAVMPAPPAELPAVAPAARALAVDITDKGDALEIRADVPGMGKDDIKVQVSPDRVLTISGERRSEVKEGSEEAGTLRVERSFGSFLRRFKLPDNVDEAGIKAVTKDGVLTLTMPKSPEAEPKAINIDVASE